MIPRATQHYAKPALPARYLMCMGLACLTASAQEVDYTNFDLTDLGSVQVSSLGRKNASLFDTPAAASILTGQEIVATGATDFASALRMVPGIQVAQISASNFAVTARGFNDITSNKLLVLSDGRSIYDPLFSGTQWTYETPFFPDTARIEVLRGPAAALWGSNAVNGVINVVSKSAHETLGSYFSATTGDELQSQFEARHGWRVAPGWAARVYARHIDSGDFGGGIGEGTEGWDSDLTGFRADWERPAGGGLMVSGEYRRVQSDGLLAVPILYAPYLEFYRDDRNTRGGHAMARWTQSLFSDGELRVQASAERQLVDQAKFHARRTTFSFDATITARPLVRQEVIAGLTYNGSRGRIAATGPLTYSNPNPVTEFTGGFVQDEISLAPKVLTLTLGTKLERNSYSGWELQPSVRVMYHPTSAQALWFGFSRAARTPSSSERDLRLLAQVIPPNPPSVPYPAVVTAQGSSAMSSEHLWATELGYRWRATPTLSFDLTTFYNSYDDLRGIDARGTHFEMSPVPHIAVENYADNDVYGHTYGGEFVATWAPRPRWKLEASVASLRMHLEDLAGGPIPDPTMAALEGDTPKQEYKFRAAVPLGSRATFDLMLRRTEALPAQFVDSYTGVDARFAWRFDSHWEFDVVGRNLTDPSHPETSQYFVGAQLNEISRSAFGRVTFTF